MVVTGEIVSRVLTVCSMLIGSFPNASPVQDTRLLRELEKLCFLLKCDFQNCSLPNLQVSTEQPSFRLHEPETLPTSATRIPQRSMVFHNSKYKNSRRPKVSSNISTVNLDFATKSSNRSECVLVPSPSSTFAQPSVMKSRSLSGLEVSGSSSVQCLSVNKIEPEFLFLKSDVFTPSAFMGSNNETSEMSTFLCDPILSVKCSDVFQESEFPIQLETEETNNFSMPKNSLNTCIKKVCVGTEPCTLPSIFDVVDSPPEQHTNITSDMPGLSESCNVECNFENAIHSFSVAHVRTEKFVDVAETSPKNSRFVPEPPPLPTEKFLLP